MHESGERDRAFEQALRQAVRQSAVPIVSGDCVDAEGLAAWTSGTLRTADAAAIERHISECARCQALLATFVKTAPVTAAAEPVWRRWRFNWLVPLATAATAVAIWVMIPDRDRLTAPPVESERSVAQTRPVEPAAPPATLPEPAAVPEMKAAPRRATPGSAASQAKPTTPRQSAPAIDALADETRERQEERPATLAERVQVAGKEQAKAELDRRAAVEGARADRPAPTATTIAAPGPPPPQAAPAARAPAPPPATGRLTGLAANMEAAIVLIPSPDTAARWRITAEGLVEYSPDGGQSWTVAKIQAGDSLRAGSSPRGTVCWLVGRRGAVHLTTDGRTFSKLAFPEAVDLVAVVATDDRTAIVTTADGRSFRTTDRGNSWAPAPAP